MIIKVISIIFYFVFYYIMKYFAKKDPDFKLIRKDFRYEILMHIITVTIIVLQQNYLGLIFYAIGIAYLEISAITDNRSKLVYFTPFWGLVIIGFCISCVQNSRIDFNIFIIVGFVCFIAFLKLFGMGDAPMSMIFGISVYLLVPKSGIWETWLYECYMLILAEILLYIKALINHNLSGPLKLKESVALGPYIYVSTVIFMAELSIKYCIGG